MIPYAGIGSRATPPAVCHLMRCLASSLERSGYLLRSGGAGGADDAFESGVRASENMEIYLPWRGFNGNPSDLWLERIPFQVRDYAEKIAERTHPAWHNCSPGARKLHTRNVLQIVGSGLEPVNSEMVICWTKDGRDSGGTGQALRLARELEVPVYNLFNASDRGRLLGRFNWSGEIVDRATALAT